MKRKLITVLLALTLAACNEEKSSKQYSSHELDLAVSYASTCIGTTPPTSYGFHAILPGVQGLKTWGDYNWITGEMRISAELDYAKKESASDKRTYEEHLIYVTSHELAHRLQSQTYWTASPSYIPWADRPEEKNAQLWGAVCLSKFIENNREYIQ